MGILDDAIREHLELKRQHGAESDDLERLEGEAFGPAARPGDPEFAEQAPADAAATGEGAFEDPSDSPPDASDPPGGSDIPDRVVAGEEETRMHPPPQTVAEEARSDHPELGDTADHPAPVSEEAVIPDEVVATDADAAPQPPEPEPEPVGQGDVSAPPEPVAPFEAPTAERAFPAAPEPGTAEPPESPERAIFDADDIDFGDLDLDLDEEEDATTAPPLPTEPAAEPPLPDVPFEEDEEMSLELGENESSLKPGPGAVSPQSPEPGEVAETDEAEDDEEDLLEETPDFLQDAPEGERLWFEQGAPKDFDFDED